MDQKTVRKLEKELNGAIADVICRLGLKKLPLLSSHRTTVLLLGMSVLSVSSATARPLEQGRGGTANGTSRDVSFDYRPHHERLHRPPITRRGGGDGSPAGFAAGGRTKLGFGRNEGDGNRQFDLSPVCTRVCTNHRKTRTSGFNS